MEGWIKLHRKLLDNPIVSKDSDYLAVWIYLLLNATHTEYDTIFKSKRITLQPGQLITGIISIGNKLKINTSKVQRILKTFENEKQIEQQTTNQNRLVSIIRWNEYQQNEKQNEKQVKNEWQTSEKQVKTNNNIKNINNENNEKNIIVAYETNIGNMTPFIADKILSYLDSVNEELIIEAIKIAALNNKRNTSYITGILNNWIKNGYKTKLDIEKSKEPIENKKVINGIEFNNLYEN